MRRMISLMIELLWRLRAAYQFTCELNGALQGLALVGGWFGFAVMGLPAMALREEKANPTKKASHQRESEFLSFLPWIDWAMEDNLFGWNESINGEERKKWTEHQAAPLRGKPTFHSILLSLWRRRMDEMAVAACFSSLLGSLGSSPLLSFNKRRRATNSTKPIAGSLLCRNWWLLVD